MEIMAMRGTTSYLVKVSDKKYAMVNIKTGRAFYETTPDVFLRAGYFEKPVYDDEIVKKIEKALS